MTQTLEHAHLRSTAPPTRAPQRMLTGAALVFDDDPQVRGFLEFSLQRLGMTPASVDGLAAFSEAVTTQQPAVILLDLQLGQTDAIAAFERLRDLQHAGPVILMSGDYCEVLDHSRRIGSRFGLDIAGVLRKPFTVLELQGALLAVLHSSRRESPRMEMRARRVSLSDAIRERQVEFWFQPKVNLRTSRWAGIEVLARVRHPQFGVLAPASFLSGASMESLHWLAVEGLKEALQVARKLSIAGGAPAIAINIAHSMLGAERFLEELRLIRRQTFAQAQVTLEITETDLGESEAADQFCARAALHGFKISVDDFGHGYAAFERLRSMPFVELKIERSLVHGCAQDAALQSICRAAVRLAHDFHATAVAEGVERFDDLAMVRTLGFDLVQGYCFAKPAPLSTLLPSGES